MMGSILNAAGLTILARAGFLQEYGSSSRETVKVIA